MAKNYIQEQSEQEQDLDIKARFLSDAIQSSLFDTIKARFELKHKPIARKLPYKNREGKITTRIALKLPNKHGSTLLIVRSSVDGTSITIEGSYNNWLTGQNIFGSEDIIYLSLLVFEAVCLQYEIQPSAECRWL